jgi:hypothetical protein
MDCHTLLITEHAVGAQFGLVDTAEHPVDDLFQRSWAKAENVNHLRVHERLRRDQP